MDEGEHTLAWAHTDSPSQADHTGGINTGAATLEELLPLGRARGPLARSTRATLCLTQTEQECEPPLCVNTRVCLRPSASQKESYIASHLTDNRATCYKRD